MRMSILMFCLPGKYEGIACCKFRRPVDVAANLVYSIVVLKPCLNQDNLVSRRSSRSYDMTHTSQMTRGMPSRKGHNYDMVSSFAEDRSYVITPC